MLKLRARARQTAEILTWSHTVDELERSLLEFAATLRSALPDAGAIAATTDWRAMNLPAAVLLDWDRRCAGRPCPVIACAARPPIHTDLTQARRFRRGGIVGAT